jgi:hypothetical protein
VSALLDFSDVNYGIVNWGLQRTLRETPFAKEPAIAGGKVLRGMLDPGAGNTNEVAFLLDRSAGKLYLDLNRNLDLTDDPSGVFSRQDNGNNYSLTFTNIHLPRLTQFGVQPFLMDLVFYTYGNVSCHAALRSFWQGKVTLQGADWQIGWLDNQFLLLRPWSERYKAFALNSGSLDTVPFTEKLFFGTRAYRLECTPLNGGSKRRLQVSFTPQKTELADLRITGRFVERVLLTGGPYTVVLTHPGGVVKVPVGNYSPAKVCVKSGDCEASLSEQVRSAGGRLTVSAKRSATLIAGGPLTNSVAVARRGRNLWMNYQLLGEGGAYELVKQDRSHPPEFTAYLGDKKVASGKFEFG